MDQAGIRTVLHLNTSRVGKEREKREDHMECINEIVSLVWKRKRAECLFYVALTRALEGVILVTEKGKENEVIKSIDAFASK